jgi:MoaA/NifB/PqqE/SkfB family radical SAM enzyme
MPQPIPLRVLSATEPPPLAPAAVAYGPGFHEEEHADGLPFRWMSLQGAMSFAPDSHARFLELWVRSSFHDLSQTLATELPGQAAAEHELVHGWNVVSIPVPAGADAVTLRANRLYPREYYPGDDRALAVQVRSAHLHHEAARHGHVARQQANTVLNRRELLEGRVELRSRPPKLGIDMTGACNVKPPCVYCAWDFNKALEGPNAELPFSTATLDRYGGFFEDAQELVNCSIGEPFMMKNVDELLDAFGSRGKVLELTTNGQILTEANISRLLGRNVHLYISLDAATAETYAKLRNPTFPRLLDNVRRLVAAKGGRGRLPLVYLVFMPMKANAHEVDAFVELCAELGADRLVLRPLNDSEGVELEWDRSGYHFDYQQELLPFEQLVHISGRVAELCGRHGLDLSDQLDFGGDLRSQFAERFEEGRRAAAAGQPGAAPPAPAAPEAARTGPVAALPPESAPPSLGEEGLPACTEPWTSLYVLRRGTMPCCYGGRAVAPMSDFQQAWNGELVQAIRRDLLAGRFHGYCFESPDCPIVRKADAAHALRPVQKVQLRTRRAWDRWARRGYGRLGGIYRGASRRYPRALGPLRRLVNRLRG